MQCPDKPCRIAMECANSLRRAAAEKHRIGICYRTRGRVCEGGRSIGKFAPQWKVCNAIMTDGPDFICAGMPKGGTGWLFDQLRHHPDFWIPPVKEIRYLDREVPRLNNAAKVWKRSLPNAKRRKKGPKKRHAWDERDMRFLDDILALRGQPMDVDAYARLFRHKGDLLTGDMTPNYCSLSDDVVARVGQRIPDARIILLARDPVARAWSHISMAHRAGHFDSELLQKPGEFRTFLDESLITREFSHPARVAERWARNAPHVAFRYFLFEDIVARPDETRRAILEFLGADPEKSSGGIEPAHNRKTRNDKLEMPPAIREILVDFFREELLACARCFGEAGQGWAASWGV